MTKLLICSLSLACTRVSGLHGLEPSISDAQQKEQMPKGSNVNPDAGLVADFNAKVDAYNKLRAGLRKTSPALNETTDPAADRDCRKVARLRTSVRPARSAKQGDIFTPATEAMFRRLLRPPLAKGADAADNKAIIKEDAPTGG